jgi:hypothetical protein
MSNEYWDDPDWVESWLEDKYGGIEDESKDESEEEE